KPRPPTASSVSRCGSTRATCCPTAKCRLKQPLLAMKSVVRVAPLVASVLMVVVLADVAAVLAKTQRLPVQRLRLKENNHAATFTQKVSQRAKRPQHRSGHAWRAGVVRRVRSQGHRPWPPYRSPDRIRPSCDQPPHQAWW